MPVRFAASPIAWVNDDLPSLGAGTEVADILAAVGRLGFRGVELGGTFPKGAPELSRLLDPVRLRLAGAWFGGRLLEDGPDAVIAAAAPRVALLKAMDCKVFIYAEISGAVHADPLAPLALRPLLSPRDQRRLAAALDLLAEFLARQGLALAYHPHLGTVVEDAADLAALLDGCGPAVGLTLDTGHLALAGIDAASIIRAHPARIVHVHAKDVRTSVFETVKAGGTSFLDGVVAGIFTAPGDGDLDWPDLMRALAKIGYEGWVVVEAEQDPAKANPAVYAAMGLAALRKAARQVGLAEDSGP